MNRKEFISRTLGLAAASLAMPNLAASAFPNQKNQSSSDEVFWEKIRSQFVLDENFIDFRANAASSMPRVVLNKFLTDFQYIQSFPSDRSSALTEDAITKLRLKLAKQINCSDKEVAIMRNTTEALNTAIMGIPLGKDDEVIASVHN